MINLEDKIFRYFQESIETTMHVGENSLKKLLALQTSLVQVFYQMGLFLLTEKMRRASSLIL